MHPILRSLLAVIVGGMAAIIIVTLFDASSLIFFPLSAGADPNDPASLAANSSAIPTGSFIVLIIGWGIASFTGAWIAARIADRSQMVHGLIVAGMLVVTGILNLLAIPHPAWVWIIGILAYIGGGYVGARLGANLTDDENDLRSMTP